MKKIFFISIVIISVFSGCSSKKEARSYEASSYRVIKQISEGEVINAREVFIKDSGSGSMIGSIIGGVIGSTIGAGDGRTLAMLGGAIAGGVAGDSINEKNAQELTVKLDKGDIVVVVVRGTELNKTDRVRIIRDGNKIATVYKINN